MKLDDEVYDERLEKIRKTMNFYGYQNREMADDILSDVSMPISRPLQETIRTQQAEIEWLKSQRDRLVQVAKIYRECNEYGTPSCQKGVVTNCKCIGCNKELHESLIAEIEAENG